MDAQKNVRQRIVGVDQFAVCEFPLRCFRDALLECRVNAHALLPGQGCLEVFRGQFEVPAVATSKAENNHLVFFPTHETLSQSVEHILVLAHLDVERHILRGLGRHV
jgi:hypothetical protein